MYVCECVYIIKSLNQIRSVYIINIIIKYYIIKKYKSNTLRYTYTRMLRHINYRILLHSLTCVYVSETTIL